MLVTEDPFFGLPARRRRWWRPAAPGWSAWSASVRAARSSSRRSSPAPSSCHRPADAGRRLRPRRRPDGRAGRSSSSSAASSPGWRSAPPAPRSTSSTASPTSPPSRGPIDPARVGADARIAHEILVAVSATVGLLLVLIAPLAVSLGARRRHPRRAVLPGRHAPHPAVPHRPRGPRRPGLRDRRPRRRRRSPPSGSTPSGARPSPSCWPRPAPCCSP